MRFWAALACLGFIVALAANVQYADGVRRERDLISEIRAIDGVAPSIGEYRRLVTEVNASEDRLRNRSALISGIGLLSIFGFALWLRVAQRNLKSFRLYEYQANPLGAFGVCFIPLINLVQPFFFLADIWRGSEDRAVNSVDNRYEWCKEPIPPLLILWWCSVLLGLFLPFVIGWIAGSGETDSAEIARRNAVLYAMGLRVMSLVITIWVILEVTSMQRAALRRVDAWRARRLAAELP